MSHSTIPETETAAVDLSPSGLEAGVPLPTVRVAGVGRGVALAIIATVAVVFALQWAQSLLISLLPGILFGYVLNPLVVWLERIRTPRVAGSSMVIAGFVGTLILGTCSLRRQVQARLDQLPEAVSKLSAGLADLRKGQASTVERVQTAASEIEEATRQTANASSTVPRVDSDPAGLKLGNFPWTGSMGAAELLGQAAIVLFPPLFPPVGRHLQEEAGAACGALRVEQEDQSPEP